MWSFLPARCGALVLSCVFAASAVRAESATPPDASRRAEAEAQYAEGAAAYKAGRYHEAVERFLTADRIAPSAALSFNTARAYEKLQDPARALEYYRDYLRRGPNAELEEKVRARISELEATLKERGVQQLTVRSEPDAADVHVDGRLVGRTPWTGELSPGTHLLLLERVGHAADSREVVLPADHAAEVSVALSPALPSTTANVMQRTEGTRDTNASSFSPGPWLTMGIGGAALVGAGVFEALRHSAAKDARETPQSDFDAYRDRYDRADAHQTTARVLAVSGGVLVVAGGVWALLDGRQREPERTKTAIGCGMKSCFGSIRVPF